MTAQPYLPDNSSLSGADKAAGKLARVFSNVTTAYKFYWLFALLHLHERNMQAGEPDRAVSCEELALFMLAQAWFPVNFCNLRLGHNDELTRACLNCKDALRLKADAPPSKIFQGLKELWRSQSPEGIRLHESVKQLCRYVPYRFLAPWIPGQDKKSTAQIITLSQDDKLSCLYELLREPDTGKLYLRIKRPWAEYLFNHHIILEDFASFALCPYLERCNVNVLNIAGKIRRPASRSGLASQRQYFLAYMQAEQQHSRSVECIYSGRELSPDSFDLDHFIPWSYMLSDEIWNLVPADKIANIQKSDAIPDLEQYLPGFCHMQQQALRFHVTLNDKSLQKFRDAYEMAFKEDIGVLAGLPEKEFTRRFAEIFEPMAGTAERIKFPRWSGWQQTGSATAQS